MIEIRTSFNPGITNALLKLEIRRIWWMFLIFPIFFCAIGVLGIVGQEDSSDVVAGIVIIVFGIGVLPLIHFLSRLMQKFMNKTMKLMNNETLNYFRFEQSMFYQETIKGNEYRSTAESVYALLHKAYETKSHFFLFISNMQTHVIPKKDIVTGSAQELSILLNTILGKRFKRLNIK